MPRRVLNGAAGSPEQRGGPKGREQTDQSEDEAEVVRSTAAAAGVGMPMRRRGAAAAAAERSGKPLKRLESFSDLPDYLRDNEFIIGSYRPQQSVWSSVKSVFRLHNETGNVWTHLLGAPRPRSAARPGRATHSIAPGS